MRPDILNHDSVDAHIDQLRVSLTQLQEFLHQCCKTTLTGHKITQGKESTMVRTALAPLQAVVHTRLFPLQSASILNKHAFFILRHEYKAGYSLSTLYKPATPGIPLVLLCMDPTGPNFPRGLSTVQYYNLTMALLKAVFT